MPSIASNRNGLALSKHNIRTLPKNSVSLSRAINVVVNGKTIGYIQSLVPTEGRHVHKVYELGHLDMVELVPGAMNENTLQVQRMLLYHSRMVEVLDGKQGDQGNKIEKYPVSLLDFNYPFDIEIYLLRPDENPESKTDQKILLERYISCWFVRLSYEVKVGEEFQIIEQADINYTYREGKPLIV